MAWEVGQRRVEERPDVFGRPSRLLDLQQADGRFGAGVTAAPEPETHAILRDDAVHEDVEGGAWPAGLVVLVHAVSTDAAVLRLLVTRQKRCLALVHQ